MNETTMESVYSIDHVTIRKSVYFFVKRIFDIFVGLIGLVFLLPVSLIVKIAYMINGDFESIIYKQARIGKNGKTIYIYKFRTMVPHADVMLFELLKKNKKLRKEWEANQKLDNDPRITKVGKVLRKTSIDEMPQFINLLKGEMSLVGPRPLVHGELDAHNGSHQLYESVKPGITGWWACNGRSATNYTERLRLEYYYATNCSISLDIKCILLTVVAVIKRDGAK